MWRLIKYGVAEAAAAWRGGVINYGVVAAARQGYVKRSSRQTYCSEEKSRKNKLMGGGM